MGHHSWGSMLRTVRAAAAVMVLGGIGLTVPPQTRDMLAFLDNSGGWPAISFQIALVVLAGSAWFWSRAALAARFAIDDGARRGGAPPTFNWMAFIWLPRSMLVASFLVGVVIALRSGSPARNIAIALGLGVVGLILLRFRPRGRSVGLPPAARYGFHAWLRGGARARLYALLRRAPYGTALAMVWLALGLVPLALGVIESFTYTLRLPNRLAVLFPGPGIAVLLLGLMIGPLVATTFLFDGLTFRGRIGSLHLRLRRPPVLSFILLYVFVLVPALFHVHTVRLIADTPIAVRQPLDKVFKQWVTACAPEKGPVQPIVVAVSGGATRAGLWGAAVLDKVLRTQQSNGPALFAVSSVSGGSLGAAGAMTLLSLEDRPCRAQGLPLLRPKDDKTVPLAGDALGPLLGGWLLDDIPRAAFDPIAALIRLVTRHRPNGGDSAEAIEHGFEDLWSKVRAAAAPKKVADWDQPFLSLFYSDSTGTYRSGMPLWFANGTDATTGNRVITTPILPPDKPDPPNTPYNELVWPFRGARDFHTLMRDPDTLARTDVTIATVINNTARFPYLEPFGEMLPVNGKRQVGSLVDGGYFENEGLQTALDLAEWLAAQSETLGRPVQPIIVQATGDSEGDVRTADVMTCTNASDGAFIPDNRHSALQLLAPLMGLYHVRGGHSAVLLRQAHDYFCKPQPRFVHFYLPADQQGRPIPLNWVLSDKAAGFIWSKEAFNNRQVDNETEQTRLKAALASEQP